MIGISHLFICETGCMIQNGSFVPCLSQCLFHTLGKSEVRSLFNTPQGIGGSNVMISVYIRETKSRYPKTETFYQ